MSTGRRGRWHGSEGATAVEFSLLLPLLLTLLFGIFEFGRMFAAHTAVTTASREAARYGSAVGNSSNGIPQFTDCAAIRDAARELVVMAQLTDADIVITYDDGPATSNVVADCDSATAEPDPSTSNVTDGTRVIVDVSFGFTSAIPFIPDPLRTATLTSRDSRSIFVGVSP